MALTSFEETLRERVDAIDTIASLILEHGRSTDLHDLRVLLVDLAGRLRRDPGLEACLDDLYGSCSAYVRDVAGGVGGLSRQQRHVRDARRRFLQRVAALPESVEAPVMSYRGLEAAYAVQVRLGLSLGSGLSLGPALA